MIDSRTDCHCHILPLLDDGSKCMAESVLLARYQVKWGFRKAVCTSHRVGKYPNVPEDVIRACDALQEELVRQDVPIELTPSMEYRLIPETWPETLEKGWLLPWEGNHILIELPIHKASRIGDIVPEDEIKRLQDEINEKTADTLENDARLKELQEAYGIDPDSEENNELSKLAFKINNSKDGLSDEEKSKMSEYQQQALYYVAKNQQNLCTLVLTC